MTSIRCHAFVSAREVIVNAVVVFDELTGRLVSVGPFDGEIHSTSAFDGIAVAGDADLTDDSLSDMISREAFSESLRRISALLRESDVVRLVRM